jgi:putative serine/threonine protein kinase
MKPFAKGKRSLIYKEKDTIIKLEHPDSKAIGRIENEAKWLKILNKHDIGPKFLKFEDKKVYMKYVEGEKILDYCSTHTKLQIRKVLLDLLEQCYTLDKLQVNKYEMHKPLKHVIVSKDKPVLIDFERCKKTKTPKNVTQLAQFYARYFGIIALLAKAKAYKETYSAETFKEVKECVMKEAINMLW